VFLFPGGNAAMPPPRYALTQWATAPTPTPSRRAACLCRMPPNTGSIAFCLVVFCQIFVGRFGVSFSPFERLFLGRFGFGQSCGLSVIA